MERLASAGVEMAVLSDNEVRAGIAGLPGWELAGGEIAKEYTFSTFMEAIAFINRIAERADAADHHPDLTNHYTRVRVALRSWSAGGVTDADVAMAYEVEQAGGV